MSRLALTEEAKQAKINEFIEKNGDKHMSILTSVDKQYQYVLRQLRVSKPKTKEEGNEVDTVITGLSSLLKKKLSTDKLMKLKDSLESSIASILLSIEANRKEDDIVKLKAAIAAMESAGLDTNDVKVKLEELKK